MIKQKSKADIALFGADDPSKDYIIDSSTNNLSFIRMYKYLKGRGIKNNKFFLRLYHKDLLGVDPLDHNNLTPQQKRMIVAECTRNPWYYLRELVRIEAAGTLMRFELSPGNLAIIWSILNSINIYGEMPRQRGKTIAVAAVLNWVYNFGTVNTPMLFGNKSLGDSKNNLKRLKDITTNLPPYVRDAVYDPKVDNDKIEAIASAARNNRININGNPRSADDANKMGRGMTIPIWWPVNICSNPIAIWGGNKVNCWQSLKLY